MYRVSVLSLYRDCTVGQQMLYENYFHLPYRGTLILANHQLVKWRSSGMIFI